MRISDWSSDVCSSDLLLVGAGRGAVLGGSCVDLATVDGGVDADDVGLAGRYGQDPGSAAADEQRGRGLGRLREPVVGGDPVVLALEGERPGGEAALDDGNALLHAVDTDPRGIHRDARLVAVAEHPAGRSEEHTSGLQSLMRDSY